MWSETRTLERGCQNSGKPVDRVHHVPWECGCCPGLEPRSRFRVKIMALAMRNSATWQEWSSEVTPQKNECFYLGDPLTGDWSAPWIRDILGVVRDGV